jgi:quercetin dioxygenase-like cupin family protein
MATHPVPLIVPPGEGKSIAVVGDVYTYLATGDDTNDQYALFHAVVPPGGGPPPHSHSREDEQFYVLEGEITFFADGKKIVGGPGTFLHLPKGSLHAFKNEGSKVAKMLIQVIPSGLEKMFEEVGQAVSGPTAAPPPVTQEEISKLLAAAPRYGIEIRLPDGH